MTYSSERFDRLLIHKSTLLPFISFVLCLAVAVPVLAGSFSGIPEQRPTPTKKGPGDSSSKIDLSDDIFIALVKVKAGAFMMGSPKDEEGRQRVDEDSHRQKIEKDFYIGTTEITQAQYEKVMGKNPSKFKGDSRPVECVSWFAALEFCLVLSKKTGRNVRLPTEAEWEYACRAGTKTAYNTGKKISTRFVNFKPFRERGGEVNRKETVVVGSLKNPNRWGLHDMHGNVWEWTSSRKKDYPYDADDGREDVDEDGLRILRGGGWGNGELGCRSAMRYPVPPENARSHIGFRIVVEED